MLQGGFVAKFCACQLMYAFVHSLHHGVVTSPLLLFNSYAPPFIVYKNKTGGVKIELITRDYGSMNGGVS